MKIKIIVVGKTKEKFLQLGEEEFQRRLASYGRLESVVVKEEKAVSNKGEQTVRLKEGERILSQLSKGAFVVALDRRGEQLSSEQLAEFLQQKMNEGCGELVFIIGGTWGLGENVLKTAHRVLSLSKMTFTHEMSRLILLEQLYRAVTILKGMKYHKA